MRCLHILSNQEGCFIGYINLKKKTFFVMFLDGQAGWQISSFFSLLYTAPKEQKYNLSL